MGFIYTWFTNGLTTKKMNYFAIGALVSVFIIDIVWLSKNSSVIFLFLFFNFRLILVPILMG